MAGPEIPFDYAAWRMRMAQITGSEMSPARAAVLLYCSRSHYHKLEKTGVGAGVYAWAAYGLEKFYAEQKTQHLP